MCIILTQQIKHNKHSRDMASTNQNTTTHVQNMGPERQQHKTVRRRSQQVKSNHVQNIGATSQKSNKHIRNVVPESTLPNKRPDG